MNKIDINGFIENHKQEIAIAAVSGVVGIVGGIIGHKLYVKDYGAMMHVARELKLKNSKLATKALVHILHGSYGMYWDIPGSANRLTLRDVLSDEAYALATEDGYPNVEITGLMVGVKTKT